jgi:hypothetical protein
MSSRRNRQQQLRAAKERRQKQIAIGGAVVLAVVLAVQVPRLMHRGGSPAAVTAAAGTTATETTTSGTTTAPTGGTTTSTLGDGTDAAPTGSTAAGATPTSPATTHTELPDSDVAPRRLRSQLASFELFDSKDPFVQQVKDAPAPTAGAATIPTAPAGTGNPTASGTTTTPGTPPSATTTQPPVTGRTLAHTLSALIEVNGKPERVGVDQVFPASSPTFKLVSLANGVAMIGIASGAYASGAQTVALQPGRTLTLVDTTDGVRYQLRLVSTS